MERLRWDRIRSLWLDYRIHISLHWWRSNQELQILKTVTITCSWNSRNYKRKVPIRLPACSQQSSVAFLCQCHCSEDPDDELLACQFLNILKTCSFKCCLIPGQAIWFALTSSICLFGSFRRTGLSQLLKSYPREHPMWELSRPFYLISRMPVLAWPADNCSAANCALRHWYSFPPGTLFSLICHIQEHSRSYQDHIIALHHNISNNACIIH